MSQLNPLPGVINGYKVIEDLGYVRNKNGNGVRRCVAECPTCLVKFTDSVPDLKRRKIHHCFKFLDIDADYKRKLKANHNGIVSRCNNPKDKDFYRYGARGIKVSPKWKRVYEFCVWSMSNGYKPGLTLDRINNDEGYSPDNCRWVTVQVNSQNRRNSVLNPALVGLIKKDLETMNGVDVAIKYGFTKQLISCINTGSTWDNVKIVDGSAWP